MNSLKDKINQLPWSNNQAHETALSIAGNENTSKVRNRRALLATMFQALSEMYPEDRETVSTLVEWEDTEILTGKKVRIRNDVFGKVSTVKNKPCKDCPDIDSEYADVLPQPGINVKKKPFKAPIASDQANVDSGSPVSDLGSESLDDGKTVDDDGITKVVSLPADLMDKDTTKAPVIELSDIVTLEDAKEFLKVGERPSEDVVKEIKIILDAAGWKYNPRMTKLDKLVKVFYDYVKS